MCGPQNKPRINIDVEGLKKTGKKALFYGLLIGGVIVIVLIALA